MFSLFKVVRSSLLLGFSIGFSSLAVSYLLSGISEVYNPAQQLASWTSLLASSYGFAFLATTYLLRRNKEGLGKFAPWAYALLMVVVFLATSVIVIPPFLALPSYQMVDELFRVFNLVMLAYIILSLHRVFEAEPVGIASAVLSGFTLLAFGQFSGLLWALEDGYWSYGFLHFFRIAGLLALLIVPMFGSSQGEEH